MDLSKLTNAEIAFLTYACEGKHDRVRHNPEAKKRLVSAGEKLSVIMGKEYHKRKLHWEEFYKEDY